MDTGKFVISLDFELMWGVILRPLKYGDAIIGTRIALEQILSSFENIIKATFLHRWFYFIKTKDLLENVP
jgi:hypothetical protein